MRWGQIDQFAKCVSKKYMSHTILIISYNDFGHAWLEICGILVANATMFSHLRDSHEVANICYCHKLMVLLIERIFV